MSETIRAVGEVSQILEETEGIEKDDLDFYSFTNESAVEHCFAVGVQQTQYSVLSHEQYARQKVDSAASLIQKCCETPFHYPMREQRQYQFPVRTDIAAVDVFQAQAQILNKRTKEKDPELSKEMKRHV